MEKESIPQQTLFAPEPESVAVQIHPQDTRVAVPRRSLSEKIMSYSMIAPTVLPDEVEKVFRVTKERVMERLGRVWEPSLSLCRLQ